MVYTILDFCIGMAGNSFSEDDGPRASVPSGDANNVHIDDLFLVMQRSTLTISKIYNELFDKSRAEFISNLSDECGISELRYV